MRFIPINLIISVLLLGSCAPNLGPSSTKISGYVIHLVPGGIKGRSAPQPVCPSQEAPILDRNARFLDKLASHQWEEALNLLSRGFNSNDSLKKIALDIFEKMTPLLKADKFRLAEHAQNNGPCPNLADPLASFSYVVSIYQTADQSKSFEIMQERDLEDGVVRISGILYSEFRGTERTMWLEAYKLNKLWFRKDLLPESTRMTPQQFH